MKELKLDGLINGSEAVVSHLEHDLSGSSVLFPMGRNKDGSLSKSSRALPQEHLRTVLKYTGEKESSLIDAMYAGEIAAAPYEMGGDTGCGYCAYRDICGFDLRINGCAYRRWEKLSVEEAVARVGKSREKAEGGDAGVSVNGRKNSGK